MFFPFLECRAVRESPRQVMASPLTWGRHMAIPEVDKSLTIGFAGNSGERQKREWPHNLLVIYGGP